MDSGYTLYFILFYYIVSFQDCGACVIFWHEMFVNKYILGYYNVSPVAVLNDRAEERWNAHVYSIHAPMPVPEKKHLYTLVYSLWISVCLLPRLPNKILFKYVFFLLFIFENKIQKTYERLYFFFWQLLCLIIIKAIFISQKKLFHAKRALCWTWNLLTLYWVPISYEYNIYLMFVWEMF